VLYSFCPQPTCQDGATPLSPLGLDAKGNIFGTTLGGGVTNSGVVFKVVPNGVLSTEKVVYSFCGKTDCVDGLLPYGGVSVDSSGNVFGTTAYGGAFPGTNCDNNGHGCGIVFEVHGSSFKVLHSFCETGPTSCKDGAIPFF